jgi:phosphonoacetate hydrolase
LEANVTHLHSRRTLLKYGTAAAASAALGNFAGGQTKKSEHQRVVVIMFDGFDPRYIAASKMPVLAQWKKDGIYKQVKGVMPSVTNANNASICCGAWPETHGIIANSYFDEKSGEELYVESADLVLAPTLFERAAKQGVKSVLLSSKAKTATLLLRGADTVMTAETPGEEWVRELGPAPVIYSAEINYWLMAAAIHVLKTRPEIGVLYVHTTDYPMHMWAPEAPESQAHLARMDQLLGEAMKAAPDAAFLATADHGMNAKSLCWDLEQVCAGKGTPIRKAVSTGRDRYMKHHRGCSGAVYIHLKNPQDAVKVRDIVSGVKGVERILSREEAAREFRLMASRIGDLMVFGDQETVFGELDDEKESFPGLRSHGSLHETDVPLFVYNAKGAPSPDYFNHNLDLARWLFT